MPPVEFSKEGPIARITLNDPERLNALSAEMGETIAALVPKINKDSSIRVVILTGAGRAFSAGGNLDIIIERTKKSPGTNRREMVRFYNMFLSLRNIEVPVIAIINGPAIGAGFCLALACDLRIASSESKMGVNFAKIGISPGMGSTFLLPTLLGMPTALDLLLTGRTLDAHEALRLGIVHRLAPPESLPEETTRLAQEIAANAPIAVQMAKQGLALSSRKLLQNALDFESKGQAICFRTEDIKEGIEAIRTKRAPRFNGR